MVFVAMTFSLQIVRMATVVVSAEDVLSKAKERFLVYI